ncbi:hypothetical protein [Aliiglaciecola sp. LCG003]|uniref:hypothetical protein n=1 Tax=Aliiglaciecola sp. LCG003 TaxID=3053655 RepID=UPI0025723EFC|nr:hypothetical protein [Aliiglaciecola sp. LCG003]WJG10987.1 hypothetical protein QR722_08165 [Aliiglaciecola sp. LCG003]
MEVDLHMHSIVGLKPMKSSEVVKIHRALDGHEPGGVPYYEVLNKTEIEPIRLRNLLERYHYYFTQVGDSGRFIVNRHYYNNGNIDEVIDSIERRNVRVAIAKFTPFFILGLMLLSSTIGFMLSAIVNKHGGYF